MLAEKALRVIREKVELLYAAGFGFGLYRGEEGRPKAVATVRSGDADGTHQRRGPERLPLRFVDALWCS